MFFLTFSANYIYLWNYFLHKIKENIGKFWLGSVYVTQLNKSFKIVQNCYFNFKQKCNFENYPLSAAVCRDDVMLTKCKNSFHKNL